ncbi:hypothetical protein QW180_17050 [Vibrio sinaloensis]|nr:hypothetical protein [Vibrio sinaloensis]
MFGTYEPEVETVRYGVTKPVNSFNPITVTFHEWRELWADAFHQPMTIKQRLKVLLSPPRD